MSKNCIAILLYIMSICTLQAQTCINWQQQIGSQENENALDAKVAPNGESYWVVGFNNTENMLNTNISSNGWLLQFNLDGTLEEDYQFGNEEEEVFTALDFLNENIIIGGYTSEIDTTFYDGEAPSDFWMNSVDLDGNSIWQFTFGGNGNDKINDLVATNTEIYFTGYSDAAYDNNFLNYGDDDLIVGKLDGDGNIIWLNNYGGTGEDRGNNIHYYNNSLFILGQTRSSDNDVSFNFGSRDYWLLELNALTGEIIREKTFGGTVGDVGLEMVMLENGDWAIIGESLSSNGDVSTTLGNGDFWVLKIDESWNKLWDKTFGGSSADFPQSITANNNGEILIAGSTLSDDDNITTSFGFIDTWIAKLNSADGNIIWDQSIGGNDLDFATRIFTAGDEILVAGFTDSPSIECGRLMHEFHDLWFFNLKDQIVNSSELNHFENQISVSVDINKNTVFIENPNYEKLNVKLFTLDGRLVYTKLAFNDLSFSINEKPENIYILNLSNDNFSINRKINLRQ